MNLKKKLDQALLGEDHTKVIREFDGTPAQVNFSTWISSINKALELCGEQHLYMKRGLLSLREYLIRLRNEL